jgi:hypothetical protein
MDERKVLDTEERQLEMGYWNNNDNNCGCNRLALSMGNITVTKTLS